LIFELVHFEALGEDPQIPTVQICNALNVPTTNWYRWTGPPKLTVPEGAQSRPYSPRALSSQDREAVRALLNSDRFCDQSPREVYATLLDEGSYHCSIRTMYRILNDNQEVQERRNQRRLVQYKKPELLATAPNQVWSWDISKLRGPQTWHYYYLYVLLDIYSRYVVSWMIAEKESAELGKQLIEHGVHSQSIQLENNLTIHADRGKPMAAKTTSQLMIDLGVARSHSRPYTSNDNPYSEAHFKTAKYRPGFPDRFGSVQDARAWGTPFFKWYNDDHHHTGIALLTPADVHYGRAKKRLKDRTTLLNQFYHLHPERFVNGIPTPSPLPDKVWINPPTPEVKNEAN
jgi:putative transposase